MNETALRSLLDGMTSTADVALLRKEFTKMQETLIAMDNGLKELNLTLSTESKSNRTHAKRPTKPRPHSDIDPYLTHDQRNRLKVRIITDDPLKVTSDILHPTGNCPKALCTHAWDPQSRIYPHRMRATRRTRNPTLHFSKARLHRDHSGEISSRPEATTREPVQSESHIRLCSRLA